MERPSPAVVAAVPRQQQRQTRHVLLVLTGHPVIEHVVLHRQRLGQSTTFVLRQVIGYELQFAQVQVERGDSNLNTQRYKCSLATGNVLAGAVRMGARGLSVSGQN